MISRYARARAGCMVCESPISTWPELEIQARVFAGEFGTTWTTNSGRKVEVVHFGEWNHEAGPDFRQARLRFDDGKLEIGDVEIDPDPRDWEHHGHAHNPAYASVLLQLYVNEGGPAAFARTHENRAVEQAALGLPARRGRIAPGTTAPVDEEAACRMVAEAAEFRLQRKHEAHARAVSLHGADTAIFHGLAAGLGYKNNAIPFLLTAQRCGLRAATGEEGEARLFGLAGFLQPRTFDDGHEATRDYLKPLWDRWWAVRDGFSRLMLEPSSWKLSGIRPSNHPHRRMGALAVMASHSRRLRQAKSLTAFEEILATLEHPFWNHHWNLSADPLERPMALIGNDRVRDLTLNVFLPSLHPDEADAVWKNLPGPAASSRVLLAASWLMENPPRAWLRLAKTQQGLLQLFADFGSLPAREAWEKIRG